MCTFLRIPSLSLNKDIFSITDQITYQSPIFCTSIDLHIVLKHFRKKTSCLIYPLPANSLALKSVSNCACVTIVDPLIAFLLILTAISSRLCLTHPTVTTASTVLFCGLLSSEVQKKDPVTIVAALAGRQFRESC